MNKERMTVTARHAGLDGPSPTPGLEASTDTTVDGLEPIGPPMGGGLDGADAIGLDDDPFGDDDLESKLQARAPFPVTRLTAGLAGLVLVVAGFLGGVLVQKNFGTASSSNSNSGLTPASLASRAAAFGNFGNRGGGGTGGTGTGGTGTGGAGTGTGAPTTGKITLVDGTTVYVTTSTGDVVIIKTNSSTTVRADQTLTLKQLTVGSTVTVTGTTASDGSVTATSITQQK